VANPPPFPPTAYDSPDWTRAAVLYDGTSSPPAPYVASGATLAPPWVTWASSVFLQAVSGKVVVALGANTAMYVFGWDFYQLPQAGAPPTYEFVIALSGQTSLAAVEEISAMQVQIDGTGAGFNTKELPTPVRITSNLTYSQPFGTLSPNIDYSYIVARVAVGD